MFPGILTRQEIDMLDIVDLLRTIDGEELSPEEIAEAADEIERLTEELAA